MKECYDMVIVGGGPGGYTAALYGARAGLTVLLLERTCPGGQMSLTGSIENYPGMEEIAGFDLGQKMKAQAERFGVCTVLEKAERLELHADVKKAYTETGCYCGKTLLYAAGADPRHLGLRREDVFLGRGVHYCAACDGMFYRGRRVAVVGGGNAAVGEALHLSRLAAQVILIYRGERLRAWAESQRALAERENVELRLGCVVEELLGQERLSGVRIRDRSGGVREIACDGVFVSIGRVPNTAPVAGQLELDEQGYIQAGEDTITNLPGVYAVGDVRSKPVRQIVTAVSDGCTAAWQAQRFLYSAIDRKNF